MQALKYRILSVLLSLIFVLSAIMTGTLGWQSMSQTAKNEAESSRFYPVTLRKLEKQPDGTLTQLPLADALFFLFTEEGEQIGEQYRTDSEGMISLQLPAGNYIFEESVPAPGHIFDTEEGERKTRYPFTVTGRETETEPALVTVYNVALQGSLTIRKLVQNADQKKLTEAQKEADFSFNVTFSDNGTYAYRVDDGDLKELTSGGTLTLKHGETAVFADIPVGVGYHVSESLQPDYTVTSDGHQGIITEEGASAVFVNTYTPVPTGSLRVSKTVVGKGADKKQAFSFVAVIEEETIEFTLKDGEYRDFPDIPEGTPYMIYERTDEDEFRYTAAIREYSGTVTGGEKVILPFVNLYNGTPEESGVLEVSKEVEGEGADPEKVFTFTVHFSDGKAYPYRIVSSKDQVPPDSGEEQTLIDGERFTLKDGQTARFENLPHDVDYTVREIDAGGYLPVAAEVSGSESGGKTTRVLFVNRVPEEPALLKITKTLAGEYPERDLEREFSFLLILDGRETPFTLKHGETKTFEAPMGAHYEVREVMEDETGEETGPADYSPSIRNGSGTVNAPLIEVTAVNTYTGRVEKVISGEKTWELGGRTDVVLPDSITLRLKHGDTLVEEQTVIPGEDGKWMYAFTAPKYDADGAEIPYTLEEVSVESFQASYNGYDIVNSYLAPIQVDPPVVRKVIEGENVPKDRFDFVMTGEEGAPMPEGAIGNKKEIAIDGSGEAEFGFLTFTAPGVYTYRITELRGAVPGWSYDPAVYIVRITVTEKEGVLEAERTITKESPGGGDIKNDTSDNIADDTEGETSEDRTVTFVNTYTEPVNPGENIVIQGTKTWEHGKNPEQLRPESIIVLVYGDDALVAQHLISAGDNWQYAFELRRYAQDGHEIAYRIDEEDIPGYTKEVYGYDLVNTYVLPEPEEPNNPLGPETPENTGGTGLPKTGDGSPILIWGIVMLLSEAMLITMMFWRRKKTRQEI